MITFLCHSVKKLYFLGVIEFEQFRFFAGFFRHEDCALVVRFIHEADFRAEGFFDAIDGIGEATGFGDGFFFFIVLAGADHQTAVHSVHRNGSESLFGDIRVQPCAT